MTPEYIHTLIQYNYWARDRTLASADQLSPEQLTRNLGSSFASVLDTLVHMHFAEWIWYQRWHGQSPSAGPDASGITNVTALRDAWRPLEAQIRAFVDSLDPADLARVIDYTLMNGTPGRSAYWQMIVHVVNHGAYHRGQVATMLRLLGATPAQSTDMIVFFREQSVAAR
ncbi:MAG TPA: DinB family protein [Vicinamibacterales bacterium]|jgi:uncharacterized damage-inducible protein DinB|nr:DinB family protein [Vicinamibacterales bacterium]